MNADPSGALPSGGSPPVPSSGNGAPPPPPPGFDRFGDFPVVRFVETTDQLLLGSFQIVGADGTDLGRLRRDGVGWQAMRMSFSLDNLEGRPVYRIRPPPPPVHGIGFGGSFVLEDPFGTRLGLLDWGFPNRSSLRVNSGVTYAAQVAQTGRSFPIEASGRVVAEASYFSPILWVPPARVPGAELRFSPASGGAQERSVVVAFLAFIVSMARPGRPAMGSP